MRDIERFIPASAAVHGWSVDIGSGSLLACWPRKQEFLNMVPPLEPAA